MQKYIEGIDFFWNHKEQLSNDDKVNLKQILSHIMKELGSGTIRVCEKINAEWVTNHWIKKAILLYFQIYESQVISDSCFVWYDKIPVKRFDTSNMSCRLVPGAIVREGAFLGNNVVIMPAFVNIGAYVGAKSMIDTWSTIGSCAQIGINCHISGGVGIGGVLEPIQANPVIIEDNCFIGARSEIVEGVVVGAGSVISMGVFIGASTKIVNRDTKEVVYGKVPPYSVVVPGAIPDSDPTKPHLYAAVIIKQVDANVRAKTSINELLRI